MITKKLYQINIEKYKPGKIGKYFISSKAGNFSRASAYFDKKEKERLEKLDINEFNSECKKMIDDNIKKIKEDKLPGGLSDNFTLEDLSKKHNVSIDYLKKQLELGIKVESEHTSDKEVQREIAMDHLSEKPNYYEKLKLVEKKTMKVSEVIKLIEAKTGKKVLFESNDFIQYCKAYHVAATKSDLEELGKNVSRDKFKKYFSIPKDADEDPDYKRDKNFDAKKIEQLKENVTNEQKMSLPENIRKCIPTVVYPSLEKIEKKDGSFVLTIKKGKSIGYTLFYKLLKSKIIFFMASTMQGQTQIIIPEV